MFDSLFSLSQFVSFVDRNHLQEFFHHLETISLCVPVSLELIQLRVRFFFVFAIYFETVHESSDLLSPSVSRQAYTQTIYAKWTWYMSHTHFEYVTWFYNLIKYKIQRKLFKNQEKKKCKNSIKICVEEDHDQYDRFDHMWAT